MGVGGEEFGHRLRQFGVALDQFLPPRRLAGGNRLGVTREHLLGRHAVGAGPHGHPGTSQMPQKDLPETGGGLANGALLLGMGGSSR
jgi:hypothetical protein